MKRLLVAALLIASMPGSRAFVAYYYNGQVARWDLNHAYHPDLFNPSTRAIKFFLGPTWSPNNRTAELNALRAAFAQWQAIPGTTLRFEDAGIATTGIDINGADNRNLLFFTTATTVNGGLDSMVGRAALTSIALDDANRILEADIAFNAREVSWFTDYNNMVTASRFVETIALHEIGHFIGLDHTPVGGGCVIEGTPGMSPAFGLSDDEIAAARFLYPNETIAAYLGTIVGTVRAGGAAVFGAIVVAEDAAGNIAQATISDAAGNYRLSMLPPGDYTLRVTPLDPSSGTPNNSLMRGRDVAPDYVGVNTSFRPLEGLTASVTAGGTATVNANVVAGNPAIRVSQISKPAASQVAPSPVRTAHWIERGQTIYTGVIGASIPADAVFSITGDGVTVGPMIYEPARFGGGTMHLLQAQVTVAADATPGLRSFVVRRGNDVAFANGYLEIKSPTHDYNFDGLDDRFQRQYFPLFTAPEAGPGADPDADRFSNAFEAATGSNPVDPRSYSFLIQRIEITRSGARVTWRSDVGKRYQLYSKPQFQPGAAWQTVGGAVTAVSETAEVIDSSRDGTEFYRLELLP